jgi:hypothetical protein
MRWKRRSSSSQRLSVAGESWSRELNLFKFQQLGGRHVEDKGSGQLPVGEAQRGGKPPSQPLPRLPCRRKSTFPLDAEVSSGEIFLPTRTA